MRSSNQIAKQLVEQFLNKAEKNGSFFTSIPFLRTNSFSSKISNILIRTASDLSKRYFFGLNYINAEEIYNLDNSFFIFICGSAEQTIILPSDLLIKKLPEISHDRNGEYKIVFTQNLELVLKGRGNRLDCSAYINNWKLLLEPPLIWRK